jgi:Helix-turn-helix domain
MKPPQKTQRQIVLEMLEEAGDRGLHSFEFIQARIPRVAARVCELRSEGWGIESEREALHGSAEGVRYVLNLGVESDDCNESQPQGQGLPENRGVTLDSGVAALSPPPSDEAHARNPYEFEVWAA